MADEGGGQGAGMGQGERIMLRFTITDYVPPTWICERCVACVRMCDDMSRYLDRGSTVQSTARRARGGDKNELLR